jgi:hypothetical protein
MSREHDPQLSFSPTASRPTSVEEAALRSIGMDVTSGLTLREVARKLLAAGAAEVSGVVLARQPFGERLERLGILVGLVPHTKSYVLSVARSRGNSSCRRAQLFNNRRR